MRSAVATVMASCLIAGIIAVTSGVEAPRVATAAPTEQVVFHVNSAEFGVADANVSDGVCDTGSMITLNGRPRPRCTLRAAIEQANARSVALGATTGEEVLVTLDPDFVGGTIQAVSPAAGAYMSTTKLTDVGGTSTWFVVKAPMTIDLQDRLKTTGRLASSVFAITGSHVTIKNASNILGGDNSFVVTETASYVTIDSGTTYQTGSNFTKRFLVINNGARDVIFSNYKVGSLAASSSDASDTKAAVVFTPGIKPDLVTRHVLIDRVDFTSPWTTIPTMSTCMDTVSTGCVNTAVTMTKNTRLDGFEMRGSTVKNLYPESQYGYYMAWILNAASVSPGTLANLSIHDNTFTKNYAWSTAWAHGALILLPDNLRLTGTNTIADNVFDNSAQTSPAQVYAISWGFTSNAATNPSGLSITDNHFDGFATTTISLTNAGLVTVARNTFGTKSASSSTTSSEETGTTSVMLANGGTTNGTDTGHGQAKFTPWYPSAITVSPKCVVQITAKPSTTPPIAPVALDVYWTASRTAEAYLGSTPMTISGTSTTVVMQLPPQAVKDGVASGYIRIQTHTMGKGAYAQALSTQFSRTLTVPPKSACTPPEVEATHISRTHGPVDGGGALTLVGKDFDYDTPQVSFQLGDHEEECADLVVVSPSEATCVIPPSPLPGDGAGVVDVIATASGNLVGAFPRAYTYVAPTATQVTPDQGPIEGSTTCSVSGSNMVTLIEGVRFPGTAWIDTKVTQTKAIELDVDFQIDAGNGMGKAVLGAGSVGNINSIGVGVGASSILQGTGLSMSTLASPYDTDRHTVAFRAGTWLYDGVPKLGNNPGNNLSAVPIYLGASNAGGSATGASAFNGVVYSLRLWSAGELVRDLHPAAWTVRGVTVYGFLDSVTGGLYTAEGLRGKDNVGRPLAITPTTVHHGVPVDPSSVTVTSDSQVVYACPPHVAATVDVRVVVDSAESDPVPGGYQYWVDGSLTVVTRAWMNADGLDHEQIVGVSGNSGAVEVGRMTMVRLGTKLWWTHTLTYSYTDPVTGDHVGTGQPGLTGVDVTHSAHVEVVCTVEEVRVNVPTGCVVPAHTPGSDQAA
ncbi:MAG: IPT/TIG domain-containing protein [Propionibacteriaceae bacterium]|nr:IPT/TIG domain-containing protein [Propionibacteriaceae bacterium]